jgi:hypothetical protein
MAIAQQMQHALKTAIACFTLTVLVCTESTYAQDNQPTVYVGVNFIKVRAGKQEQYMQLLEKYGKKVNEYFFRNNNLVGWYMYKVLMPSGSSVGYDYASVNVTTTMSALLDPPGDMKEVFKKIFPDMTDKMVSDVMARYDSCREIVRREVYMPVHGASVADSTNPVAAKYMEVDLMHPAAGKTEDYIKMERETFKPLHAERIKMGYLRSWGLYEKTFADEQSGFEFVTVNFMDNVDKLGYGYSEAVKKVMPQADMNALFTQTMATRTMIRSEIWKLMQYVDGSNTKK